MMDGEHYIRNLSDAELERFAGLNRNMYTKAELQIADDELRKRQCNRSAKETAKPVPQAPAEGADPQSTLAVSTPGDPDVPIPTPPEPAPSDLPQLPPSNDKNRPIKPAAPKTDWSEMDGDAYMHCTFCDAKVRLDAVFCTNCGKRVAVDDAIEDTHPYSPWNDGLGGSCCMSGFIEDDMLDRCCNPRI